MQLQAEELPQLLILEPTGFAYSILLELRGVLSGLGYDVRFATPTESKERGLHLPAGSLRQLLYLALKRITGGLRGYERIITIPGTPALARVLPRRLLMALEEEEPAALLRGFALAEARKSYYPRDEEEDPSPTRSKILIALPGVDEEQAQRVASLLERITDFGDQFIAAGVQFLLFPPLPDVVEETVQRRSIPSELCTIRTGESPEGIYQTLRDVDALLNTGEGAVFWAAALNKPVVTSTTGRLTPELRSLSVYFTGGRIEEIAEKAAANQLDRESLSYVRVSPHMFAQAAVASFREERNRIEKILSVAAH